MIHTSSTVATVHVPLARFSVNFKSPQHESLFKAHYQASLPWLVRITVGVGMLNILVLFVPMYTFARKNGFHWELNDPRTLQFVIFGGVFVIDALLFMIVSLQTKLTYLKRVDLEFFMVALMSFTMVVVPYCTSITRLEVLYGYSSNHFQTSVSPIQGDVNALLLIDMVMTFSAVFLRIRACVLWIPPLIGILSWCLAQSVISPLSIYDGTCFKYESWVLLIMMLCLGSGSWFGAWRHELEVREKWWQMHVSEQIMKGFVDNVSFIVCDGLVVQSSDMMDDMMGTMVQGKSVACMFGDSDLQRFQQFFSEIQRFQASQKIQIGCMCRNVTIEVELLGMYVSPGVNLIVLQRSCRENLEVRITATNLGLEAIQPEAAGTSYTSHSEMEPQSFFLAGLQNSESYDAADSLSSLRFPLLAESSMHFEAQAGAKSNPHRADSVLSLSLTESSRRTHPSAVTTVPPVVHAESSVQTDIVWNTNGYECQRCKRPPKPQDDSDRNYPAWKVIQDSRKRHRKQRRQRCNSVPPGHLECSQSLEKKGSSSDSNARFATTPQKTMEFFVHWSLQHFSLVKDDSTCCMFHQALTEFKRSATKAMTKPCNPDWKPFDRQCTKCLGMEDQGISCCSICGHDEFQTKTITIYSL